MSDWGRASLASVRCVLRGLPLFFRAAPRTPLRVLGIIALDMLHVLRHSRPIPRRRIDELALFLDFEGCANAGWDRKLTSGRLCQTIRRRLDDAGYRRCLETYLDRLQELERARPSIGGDHHHVAEVRTYREDVARLAVTTAAAIALNADWRDEHLHAAQADDDIDTLFRILMQCQIIDDVLDYADDTAAGLPTLLTASRSLPLAITWARDAARDYGTLSSGAETRVFPLRVALCVVTVMTRLVLRMADRRQRLARLVAHR